MIPGRIIPGLRRAAQSLFCHSDELEGWVGRRVCYLSLEGFEGLAEHPGLARIQLCCKAFEPSTLGGVEIDLDGFGDAFGDGVRIMS